MKRFETFGAYMFDLLFAPLKRGKRAANQFFIFFKVIGRIFDGMKKDAFRLRDELNVATASPVMLPVHGQDRDMPRLEGESIENYQATLGQEETIELSRENWLTLTNGAHQLRVEAVDGNFATSVRVWNFSKKETVIAFQFAKPEETDARATKILITPTWHIEGSVAKVEACNNAFDASPAWEDITAQVAINRVYNFLNQSKTAEKWGVNVRFTIEKNEGYEGEVSISGFGGAYE